MKPPIGEYYDPTGEIPFPRLMGENSDSVAEMPDEEFEKWAESLPDVNSMSSEEYHRWVLTIRSRPDRSDA